MFKTKATLFTCIVLAAALHCASLFFALPALCKAPVATAKKRKLPLEKQGHDAHPAKSDSPAVKYSKEETSQFLNGKSHTLHGIDSDDGLE